MLKKHLMASLIAMSLYGQEQYLSYHELYWEYEAQNLLVSGMVVHHDSEKGIYWWDNNGRFYFLEKNGLRVFYDLETDLVTYLDQVQFQNCMVQKTNISDQDIYALPKEFGGSQRLMEEDPDEQPSGTYCHSTESTFLLHYGGGTLEVGVSSDGNAWAEVTSLAGQKLVITTQSTHKYARQRNQASMVNQIEVIQQACLAIRSVCGGLNNCASEYERYRQSLDFDGRFDEPGIDLNELRVQLEETTRAARALMMCERAKFICNIMIASCESIGF